MRVESSSLRNGLRLAALRMPGAPFVHVCLAIRVGSRYEPEVQNGMSSLLEHMLHRGCRAYPSSFFLTHALESFSDGLAGEVGREQTALILEVFPGDLGRAMGVLGKILEEPLFENVELEKRILLEEMRRDTSLLDSTRESLFKGHPLSRPMRGRPERIANVGQDDLLEHFREFYQPDNMVAVAVGDIDPVVFFREAGAALSTLENRRPGEPAFLSDSESNDAGLKYPAIAGLDPAKLPGLPWFGFRDGSDATMIDVRVAFAAEGERDSRFLEAHALQTALARGYASRLRRNLRERRGMLYDLSLELESMTDVSVLDLAFRVPPDKVRIAVREVFRELHRMKTTPLDAQEYARVRSWLAREATRRGASPSGLALDLARSVLLGLDTPVAPEDWLRRLESMDPARIMGAAQRIFSPDRMVAVFQGRVPEVDHGDLGQIFELGLTTGF